MQVLCANQQVGQVVASVLHFFFLRCQARFFFHGWAQVPREQTKTCPGEAILNHALDDGQYEEGTNISSSPSVFVLVKITVAEVDRCHFTTVFTSSHAADSERADISKRPNFAHEQCRPVHPRGWRRKWLHQVVWERVCREFICELMSSERALWHFLHHFSWWWWGRCTWECVCQISGARSRKASP